MNPSFLGWLYGSPKQVSQDLIKLAHLTDQKKVDTLEINLKFSKDEGEVPSFRKLTGSLIPLIMSRSDISYAV